MLTSLLYTSIYTNNTDKKRDSEESLKEGRLTLLLFLYYYLGEDVVYAEDSVVLVGLNSGKFIA